eukprot:TRINITY_DN722_c1_g3_i1.p1 TRINITY_DN722_c1_g3~~TRINITY_DN722_c1_g3_i1.p1  ORF type:complete len:485 (-),score=99.49 TRINITY_DN722_c1_g3_i1:1242-2696(-)
MWFGITCVVPPQPTVRTRYVVNCASGRFHDFEKRLCEELLYDYHLLFLLNKTDIVSKDKLKRMKKVLLSLKLKRCCGLFAVAADPDPSHFQFPSQCAACGSDDLVARKKEKIIVCENGHCMPMTCPQGLDEVVDATVSALPRCAVESFLCAQSISVKRKDWIAADIIREHASSVVSPSLISPGNIATETVKMAMRLGSVWGFVHTRNMIAQLRGKGIAQRYSTLFSRLQLMVVDDDPKSRIAAEGISLHLAFRDMYLALIYRTLNQQKTPIPSPVEIETYFLEKIYRTIKSNGLSSVLAMLVPPTSELIRARSRAITSYKQTQESSPPSRSAKTQVFGVPLEELMSRCDVDPRSGVPSILQRMFDYVEKGAKKEGLFRVNASFHLVHSVKAALNRGEWVDFSGYSCFTVYDLLKMWFRELPAPLLPVSTYAAVLLACKNSDERESLVLLEDVVRCLPAANKTVLRSALRVTLAGPNPPLHAGHY